MRNGRDIGNARNLDAQRIQSTHGRLTAGAWALDPNFQRLDAVFNRDTTSRFRSNLRCKRGGLTRTLEAGTTRSRPRQGVTLAVGDGDDGVVERRVDMRDAVRHVLFDFLANARGAASSFGHL